MYENKKPYGILNLSPKEFEAFMVGAEKALGFTPEENLESLKTLIDAGYVQIVDEGGTYSILLTDHDEGEVLPEIRHAMRIVFSDAVLSLEVKMVHQYCAIMLNCASGVLSIEMISDHLGIPATLIHDGLQVLKMRQHINYAILGDRLHITLLHALPERL